LEQLADRWVFGERLTGYELLTRYGATLESAFDLQELIPRVAAAIRHGLGVQWVRIALRRDPADPATLEPAGADGIAARDAATPVATAALVHGGQQLGSIECGPKLDSRLG